MGSKEEQKHTATPWQIHKFKSAWDDSDLMVVNAVGASPVGRNYKASVQSAEGEHVLDAFGATEAEALANARIAVRAVNWHEAHKEALRGVAIILNAELAKYDAEPWAQRVRAALADLAQKES